jgi:hypothetical protein
MKISGVQEAKIHFRVARPINSASSGSRSGSGESRQMSAA